MANPIEARSFLLWLSTHQPRLFYKPLFSLSAADQASTLDSNRRLVGLQSKLIGASRFWTFADPQMVIIVLVGAAGPKQSKSKGKEGEHPDVHIKLGRYAVLLELIKAFEQSEESAGPGSRLRGFIDTIESRLLAMLEAEVRHVLRSPLMW